VVEHKVLKGSHLKLKLTQPDAHVMIDAIGFKLAAFEKQLAPGVRIDIVFQITPNSYMNRTTLQLQLQDLCLSA
jgi:hypothetical protein